MGIFDKIKQTLNIGLVDVRIDAPTTISRQLSKVDGSIVLTAKSMQNVKSISIGLEEVWQVGAKSADPSQQPTTQTYDLGATMINQPFVIQPGEVKTLPFSLPFTLMDSRNQRMQAVGGAVGVLGALGAAMDQEKSEYHLKVSVDIEGAALDATNVMTVNLTD